MLLDALLQPGSSVSRGALSFLDKIFIALFACIFFLIWLTDGRVRLHTSSLSSTEPRDAWPPSTRPSPKRSRRTLRLPSPPLLLPLLRLLPQMLKPL